MKLKTSTYLVFFILIFFFFYSEQSNSQTSPGPKYPETSMRYLTNKDLKGKSIRQLKIMRNEIFARHGYKFKEKDMKEYFSKQKWYNPEHDDVTLKLTRIEIANSKMLKQYEDEMQKKQLSEPPFLFETKLKIGELIKKQKREVVCKAEWGAGQTQLGRDDGQEAESCGPMSFAVDNSGRLFILDQVNKRIQVYNSSGKYMKAIPVPNSSFSDIDIGQSGNLFLLDKDISKFV